MSDNRVAEAYTEITGTVSNSGDTTVIAAPATGRRIVYKKIKLVNTTANAVNVIIKHGATSKNKSVFSADIGAGEIYYEECGVPLPEATALVFNLSGAYAVSYDIAYLTESI